MSDFIVSCCSTADISAKHFADREISYICFHFKLGEQDYIDDLGQTIPYSEFYQRMADGEMTKTSQVNVEEYADYFEHLVETGKDVLHISLSTGLSGTFNSACVAANMIKEKYPSRKIIVLDSLAASSGYGLLMDRVADLRDEGRSIEEVAEWVENHKLNMHHWFFSTDLTFYIRGGRISKTAGAIGTLLSICPLLNMDLNGKLTPRFKIRTKRKVIAAIVEQMELHAENGLDYSGKCYICESACMEDAKAVAAIVEKKFPHLNGKVEINNIGTTIGAHTGPGTVALFFWGDKRVD
jgi:DegV family protein with EDD domain